MTRTPGEIKKGLECCNEICNSKSCPYWEDSECNISVRNDALAYIRQLEAERDAAVDHVRGDCAYCTYLPGETIPDSCFDCANKGYYRWEFRGAQKEE